MAKEVEWTLTSIQDRFDIYRFWLNNNQSDTYSEKLELLFNEAAKLISEFPDIGIETDTPNVRIKIIKSYKLFYLNTDNSIQILRVWDSRQNPADLKLK